MHAWIQDVPVGVDEYRQIVERLGAEPMEGLLLHLAFRTSGGTLRYVDVWQSEALCDRAFEHRVHPAVHPVLDQAGIRVDVEPPRELVELVDAQGALLADNGSGAAGRVAAP